MVWVRSPQYFYQRGRVYYFSRAIPSDLRHRFGRRKIEFSLRTRSYSRARSSAAALSDKLERYWDSLRIELAFERSLGLRRGDWKRRSSAPSITFDDALRLYLRLKGTNKTKLFSNTAERSLRYLKDCTGYKYLNDLEIVDGAKFRDFLIAKGLSGSSVKRIIASVRSIINFASKEKGLPTVSTFQNIFIPGDPAPKKRASIKEDDTARIQSECFEIDDPQRWLIALISDTGMRLGEACGLLTDDLLINGEIPFVRIQAHPWRRLKTASSTREIPLVGASLWAAQRVRAQGHLFAFPRYCSENGCKSSSASAALNKWLKPRIKNNGVIHSFRHSIRDRLRTIECPEEVSDAIGGWATKTTGQAYGSGYSLSILATWMRRVESPKKTNDQLLALHSSVL